MKLKSKSSKKEQQKHELYDINYTIQTILIIFKEREKSKADRVLKSNEKEAKLQAAKEAAEAAELKRIEAEKEKQAEVLAGKIYTLVTTGT